MNRRTVLKTATAFLAGLLTPWQKTTVAKLACTPIPEKPLVEISSPLGISVWSDGRWVGVDPQKQRAVINQDTGEWSIVSIGRNEGK